MAERAASRPAWRGDTVPVWRPAAPSSNDTLRQKPSAALMGEGARRPASGQSDEDDDEEDDDADVVSALAPSLRFSACLASCLSAPSPAARSLSRLRFAVP